MIYGFKSFEREAFLEVIERGFMDEDKSKFIETKKNSKLVNMWNLMWNLRRCGQWSLGPVLCSFRKSPKSEGYHT